MAVFISYPIMRRLTAEMGRLTVKDPTACALITANLLVAALALREPPIVLSLFSIYWAECAIIGLFNILKMLFIPITLGPEAAAHPWGRLAVLTTLRAFLSLAFAFHYGFFLLICGALMAMLGGEELRIRGWSAAREADAWGRLLWPVLALAASHAFSFAWNFLRREEYARLCVREQMFKPYGRVCLMFFTLMAGGILTSAFRLPVLLLLVFVAFKVLADLHAHFRGHGMLEEDARRGCFVPSSE